MLLWRGGRGNFRLTMQQGFFTDLCRQRIAGPEFKRPRGCLGGVWPVNGVTGAQVPVKQGQGEPGVGLGRLQFHGAVEAPPGQPDAELGAFGGTAGAVQAHSVRVRAQVAGAVSLNRFPLFRQRRIGHSDLLARDA